MAARWDIIDLTAHTTPAQHDAGPDLARFVELAFRALNMGNNSLLNETAGFQVQRLARLITHEGAQAFDNISIQPEADRDLIRLLGRHRARAYGLRPRRASRGLSVQSGRSGHAACGPAAGRGYGRLGRGRATGRAGPWCMKRRIGLGQSLGTWCRRRSKKDDSTAPEASPAVNSVVLSWCSRGWWYAMRLRDMAWTPGSVHADKGPADGGMKRFVGVGGRYSLVLLLSLNS
jgi:hypothetical protein